MDKTLARIRALVGHSGWIDDSAIMAPYLCETRGLFHGRARAIVRPESTTQVAEIVSLCNQAGIGIVPHGGNTGRCGGATPAENGHEIVLALARLNRIRHLDAMNYTITVEAGCILTDVQAAAAAANRLFPLSLGAERSCQIGGNLASNAGGTNVLRYGTARDLTLGLEVVLADGQIWNGLKSLHKDNTGYDLKDLFIGSEGTLGIITAAVLKLFPLPKDVQTAFIALPDLDHCVELLARARETSGDNISSFELIPRIGLEFALRHTLDCRDPLNNAHPWYILLVLSNSQPQAGMRECLEHLLADAFQQGLISDAVIAKSAAQAQSLWQLREAMVEGQSREGGSIKHDISVPVSQVPDFIRTANARVEKILPGIRVCAFGHVGDGNIHYNLSQPVAMDKAEFMAMWDNFKRLVHDIVVGMGGSFSAEHGIGRLKVGEMARYKSATELALMHRLKQVLDPKGIMNAGKVIPLTAGPREKRSNGEAY